MLNLNEKMKKLNWTDIALVKVAVFFFTLFLVYFIPALTKVDWKISGVIWFVIWIYLVWKMFIKK